MDDVVIAGAGPVGLWLARELRLAVAGAVVLERDNERSPHSKALTMHPRSLEVLAMRGAQEDFPAEGLRIPNDFPWPVSGSYSEKNTLSARA